MLVARRDPFHPGAHDAPYAQDAAAGVLRGSCDREHAAGDRLAAGDPGRPRQRLFDLPRQFLGRDDLPKPARRHHLDDRQERRRRAPGACWCAATSRSSSKAAARSIPTRRRRSRPCWRPKARDGGGRAGGRASSCSAGEGHRPQGRAACRRRPPKCRPRRGPAPSAARREPGVSDAQWLDAVRQALVTHDADRAAPEAVKAPVAPAATACVAASAARGRGASHDADAVAAPAPVAACSAGCACFAACGSGPSARGCRRGAARAANRRRSSGAAGAIPDPAERGRGRGERPPVSRPPLDRENSADGQRDR